VASKTISISITANGENEKAYAFSKKPILFVDTIENKKELFLLIRKSLKEHFRTFLKMNIRCTAEYRFYISVIVFNPNEPSKSTCHSYEIDPKNLR